MSAALYAAREGIETLIIERTGVGGQAGSTERIDNYPGFAEGIGGAELADAMRAHAERFDVEILARPSGNQDRVPGGLQDDCDRVRRLLLWPLGATNPRRHLPPP